MSSNAQARQGTPEHAEAQDGTPLVINGDAYLNPGDAIDRLGEGSTTSALGNYQRIKAAARRGEVATVRIHAKLSVYREADVLELRARLLARG